MLDKIKKILLQDWDPIGVKQYPQCQDEYDSYAPGVLTLISQDEADQIEEHLSWIEADYMGLKNVDPKYKKEAVAKLVALAKE